MTQAFGSRRRELLLVGGVVLLGLFLRLAHILFLRQSPYFEAPIMDMAYHVDWARAFAAGEVYQEGPFFRAPLYPWFLGLCMKVFGPGLLAPRVIQALLGALSVALTYLVGRRAFSPAAGLAASLLVSLSWVLVHFDGLLLIPALIVPLDLLALYLTLGLVEKGTPRRAGLAGCAWGVSAIARPNVLLFMPLLAVWLLWLRRGRLKAGLGLVCATAAGCLLPILPITAINLARGDLALISTQAGVNFWIGNNPDSDGSTAIVPGTRGGWWEGYHDSIALAEAAEGRELSPTEVSQHYSGLAWEWMSAEPAEAGAHMLWKLRLFWLDVELGNNLPVEFFARYWDPLLSLSPVGFSLLAGLGVLGILLALRARPGLTFPLWGFVLAYSASVVIFFVCSRFRVPILPVLAIFSGHGLAVASGWVRERSFRSLCGGGLVVAAAVVPTLIIPDEVVDPASNGHLFLGRAALRDGAYGQAEEHFEQALELQPSSAYSIVGLSDAYRLQGLLDQAILTAELGLERLAGGRRNLGIEVPGEPELLLSLVQAHLDRDGTAGACAMLERRLLEDPGACALYDLLARLYRDGGDVAAERRVLARKASSGCL